MFLKIPVLRILYKANAIKGKAAANDERIRILHANPSVSPASSGQNKPSVLKDLMIERAKIAMKPKIVAAGEVESKFVPKVRKPGELILAEDWNDMQT